MSDQTSLAVVGMDDRQFRELLKDRAVPHADWKRHVFARVEDVLLALGLATEKAVAPSPSSPQTVWDEAEIIKLAVRGGTRR